MPPACIWELALLPWSCGNISQEGLVGQDGQSWASCLVFVLGGLGQGRCLGFAPAFQLSSQLYKKNPLERGKLR